MQHTELKNSAPAPSSSRTPPPPASAQDHAAACSPPPQRAIETAPAAGWGCPSVARNHGQRGQKVSTRGGGRCPGSAPMASMASHSASSPWCPCGMCADIRRAWLWPQLTKAMASVLHSPQKMTVNISRVARKSACPPPREDRIRSTGPRGCRSPFARLSAKGSLGGRGGSRCLRDT